MVRSESVQSPFRSRWASTALIAGVVTAAVYAYQWNALYSPERDRLLASIRSAQSDLKKAQQTAERWPEFVDESLRLERKLAEVQRKLPGVAKLVSLAGQIDGLADELGVQVQVRPQPLSEETFELYWKHRFNVAFSGPESAITTFRQRVHEMWPLTVWVDEGTTSDSTNLSLILWSRSESGWSNRRFCRTWHEPRLLWPFSMWTSELREELEMTCIGVRHFRVLLEQVYHFETMAQEIATSEAIITQIEQYSLPAERGEDRNRSERQ